MYAAIRNLIDSDEFSVVEAFEVPERAARFQVIPAYLFDSELGDYLKQSFNDSGEERSGLWTHQADAMEALGRGDNVVVSTGTASGKSMVFRALALHNVLLNSSCRIVVFYPLKALVADQLRGWREMAASLGLDKHAIGQIDGSIPVNARESLLEKSRVVVMTPDVC